MTLPAATTNSNLPFPPELRDKIFAELLVYPERHLFLNPPEDWSAFYDIDFTYARQCSILSRVSKAVREEAQNIFFGQNKWLLELRIARQVTRQRPRDQHPMRWETVFGDVKGNEALAFVRETWGEQALGLMRKVQLSIHATDLGIEEMFKDKLKDLVRILRQSTNLKELSVNWRNYYSYPKFQGRCGTGMRKASAKIIRSSRQADGTREQPIQHENWPREEMILEPLKELRGLEQALVWGSVSDQWAIWLE